MGLGGYRFLRAAAAVAVGACSISTFGACAEAGCDTAFGCGQEPPPDAQMCGGEGTPCRDASSEDSRRSAADGPPDASWSEVASFSPPLSPRAADVIVDARSEAAAVDAPAAPSPPEVDTGRSDSEAVPTHCMPIDGGCQAGMFVSPNGDDAHDGTDPALPMHTLQSAMVRAKAARAPVFACDDGRGFAAQLAVDTALDGIEVHGGYDCTTWTREEGGRTTVWSPTTTAITVTGLDAGALVDGFELRATNAKPGASSIAVMVNDSKNVTFRNVRILAADGGEGAPGADGSKGQDGPVPGPGQLGTWAACPGQFLKHTGGAWPSESTCGSRGGTGGDAKRAGAGTKGEAGTPRDNLARPGVDNGGIVDGTKLGGNGSDGLPGALGKAAPSGGSFGPSGYSPGPTGGDGRDGYPGQGGGGGGASDATGTDCTGASGGVGGIGGCGGMHGTGGASGGASVALLSWQSEVTLDACELSAATGGRGGKGGSGGPGGIGGDGAGSSAGIMNPNNGKWIVEPGGQGGQGGDGGPGGPGAGGNGGPAYAVVFHGAAPSMVNATTLASGVGGRSGIGGEAGPNVKGANGQDGSSAQQLPML